MVRALALAVTVALTGCERAMRRAPLVNREPGPTVEVPVYVRTPAPPWLLTAPEYAMPTWVAPSDPGASSALTEQGERALQDAISECVTRERAWRAWGSAGD
jgi:hypothetical protein